MPVKKQVKTTEKTQISFSVKLIVSLSLLVGVALGGYLLNMAGATTARSRCTADSCTVISRLTNVFTTLTNQVKEGQWTYVYGQDKNTPQDLNNLITAVNNGADIKVQVMAVFSICDSVYAQNNVTCEFSRLGESTTDGTYTNNFYSVFAPNNTEPPTPVDTFVTKIKYEIRGGYTKNSFATNNNVRWYIKK